MMLRRALLVTGIVVFSALLAFSLRELIYEAVVIPVAYLLWGLGLLYHALPQLVWWIAALLLVVFSFVKSLMPASRPSRRVLSQQEPPLGQVEMLAVRIHKAEKGIYNKWLVANRLGKLAHQILVQRDSGKPRSLFAPLDGPDWDAPAGLNTYFHNGIQGPFADFPNGGNPLMPSAKTPLDHDIRQAVEFLESKIDHQ